MSFLISSGSQWLPETCIKPCRTFWSSLDRSMTTEFSCLSEFTRWACFYLVILKVKRQKCGWIWVESDKREVDCTNNQCFSCHLVTQCQVLNTHPHIYIYSETVLERLSQLSTRGRTSPLFRVTTMPQTMLQIKFLLWNEMSDASMFYLLFSALCKQLLPQCHGDS